MVPDYHGVGRRSTQRRPRLREVNPFLYRGSNTKEDNLQCGGTVRISLRLPVCSGKKEKRGKLNDFSKVKLFRFESF